MNRPFWLLVILIMMTCPAPAQPTPPPQAAAGGRLVLGRLPSGAAISFVQSGNLGWGLEIAGTNAPRLAQPQPVQIEVYRGDQDVRQFAAGYASVDREPAGMVARGRVDGGRGVAFTVEDRWSVAHAVLQLTRKLKVSGTNGGAGFYSAIRFTTAPDVTWPDVEFLAPGLLYGDPTYDGSTSPGGTLNNRARRFWIREDFLPAPMFALRMRNGESITVLDPAPKGDTSLVETKAPAVPALIDGQFLFGAVGANEADNGGVDIGFRFPGTVTEFSRRGGQGAPRAAGTPATPPPAPSPSWRRRYHPVQDGFEQSYRTAFRFGSNESFPDLTRNSWRWAWQTLAPAVNYHDIEVVRRSLIDHLSERVVTIEGRTGIPFIVSTKTGEVWGDTGGRWNDPNWWWRAILGFVGKNVEAADQLLRESERDAGSRGRKMRQQGLDIIDTFIRLVPMSPPSGTGFNLKTGKPSMTNPQYNTWFLRAPAEDMRMLMEAYRRERKAGREHPEWIGWCRTFADWAMKYQREDGSFPRGFRPGTGEVVEESGTTSYNVVPLFLMLSEDSGDRKYRDSAVRAAEYVWQSFGTRGVFIGGAIDNPNITDKEAGMLSMEAFLALYERTHEDKWLKRAQAAGNFAESWIWIWNVLPVVQRAKLPVLVLNLQPSEALDHENTDAGEWLANCSTCCVPEISNALARSRVKFRVVSGTLFNDPAAWGELEDGCRAAGVARALRTSRIGFLGHTYPGMLDMYSDFTMVTAQTGAHIEVLEMCDLDKCVRAASEAEAIGKIEEAREICTLENAPEEDLRWAARVAAGLDRLAAEFALSGLTYYYRGLDGNAYERLGAGLILGNSPLTARGIPASGEGDLKTCLAMMILDRFGAGGSYTEFYAMDFKSQFVLMGHDGPDHLAICDSRPVPRGLGPYHGKRGCGVSVEFNVKTGPVTLVGMTQTAEGNLKMLCAEGESIPGPILRIGNTNSRLWFPLGPREFVNRWCQEGPTHHCALGVGHVGESVGKFSEPADIPLVEVCRTLKNAGAASCFSEL